MRAEIISVGTELLMGQIVNTDAAYLARQLQALGIDTFHQDVVGDNHGRMRAVIEEALGRSDVLLLSGGLGPTVDDMTKEVLADALRVPMVEDAASRARLEAHFASRGRAMTPNNLRQAIFPQGARILPNECGTAPGCYVQTPAGRHVFVMPGPPHELQDMFTRQVAPILEALSQFTLASRMLRVFGVGESAAAHALRDLIDQQTNPTIAPYASIGEMSLRLTAKVARGQDAAPLLDPLEREIRARLGEGVYSACDESLPEVAARLLMEQGKTVVLAESCTGGRIADWLVGVPGISKALVEGHVTYANEAKIRVLGVRPQTLSQHGAVSEQCAREMAEGARQRSGADVALAVTGIAGPDGGSPEKPVGLVYFGLSDGDGTIALRREVGFRREREHIRTLASLTALDILRRRLLHIAIS